MTDPLMDAENEAQALMAEVASWKGTASDLFNEREGLLVEVTRLRAEVARLTKELADRPLLEVGPGVLSIPDMAGLAKALRGGDERVVLENEVAALRSCLAKALEVVAEWERNFGPEPGHSRETRVMLYACRALRAVLKGEP